MKMLLAGGGTGGHLFPAVAIAEQLLQQDPTAAVRFVGTSRGLEAKLLPKLGMPLDVINMAGVVGQGFKKTLKVFPKLLQSLWQSLKILKSFAPDIVVGVGGYASFPVLIAARLRGIPFIVHEQNARPGLSNRVLARFARRICLSIPGSGGRMPQQKLVVTGNPLRRGVTEISSELPSPGKLLVFGGSRGAHAINQLISEAIPLLRKQGVCAEVIHQTGELDLPSIEASYRQTGEKQVEALSFIDDMASAYSQARLVICRAGATTIAELCACGRPAVLIPFPYAAADHQTANAVAMEQVGAAKMLAQKDVTATSLATELARLWLDQNRLENMASAAAEQGQKDAATRVIEVCKQVLSEG